MMTKTNIFARILTVFISLSLVFICLGEFSPKTHAKTLSSLKTEQQELKDKVKESEDKIKELEGQKAEQEKIIDELNKQINQLNSQIENINDQQGIINDEIIIIERKIKKLDDEIAELDRKIAEKDEEIEETVRLYGERLRANYVAGETSLLEIVTQSTSISNFFDRLELVRRVNESDEKLVKKLDEEIKEIEGMQQDLRDAKAEVEAEKAELEVKKADLQAAENELQAAQDEIYEKSNEVNKKLRELNYQTKELEVSIDKYNSDMDKIDAEIEAFLKEQEASKPNGGSSSNSHANSKGWVWPVPYSNSYVTSPYGYRNDPISGAYKFHSGIDISMPNAMGKNLVAVKSGTVIFTKYSNSGYGNYVMVDHGGGYVSLYAHCKSLAVSTGQYVNQGQVIAYIGTSGYSTGPHVHFEIRINGEKVNPANYVSK